MNDAKKREAAARSRVTSSPEDEPEVAEYRRELAGYPPLTIQEERQLVLELLTYGPDRQPQLRRRLIEGTLWRAVDLAHRYQGRGLPLAELIGEANLALVRAAQAFVPAPHRLFRHSASGYMHRALACVVTSEPYGGLCPPVEQDEGPGRGAITLALPLSLEAPFSEEDLPKGLWSKGSEEDPAPTSLLDVLANSMAFSTRQAAFDLDWVAQGRLLQALAALPSGPRQALELRYRIGEEPNGDKLRPRREIGEIMGIDQQSVGRLEERGIRAILRVFVRRPWVLAPPPGWAT